MVDSASVLGEEVWECADVEWEVESESEEVCPPKLMGPEQDYQYDCGSTPSRSS